MARPKTTVLNISARDVLEVCGGSFAKARMYVANQVTEWEGTIINATISIRTHSRLHNPTDQFVKAIEDAETALDELSKLSSEIDELQEKGRSDAGDSN